MLLFAAVALLLPSMVVASDDTESFTSWVPDPIGIKKIERKLRLPDRHYKLRDYIRYYWGTDEDGVPILNAEFQIPSDDTEKAGTVIIGRPVKMYFDGGCAIVTLRWNMASNDLVGIRCNGVA